VTSGFVKYDSLACYDTWTRSTSCPSSLNTFKDLFNAFKERRGPRIGATKLLVKGSARVCELAPTTSEINDGRAAVRCHRTRPGHQPAARHPSGVQRHGPALAIVTFVRAGHHINGHTRTPVGTGGNLAPWPLARRTPPANPQRVATDRRVAGQQVDARRGRPGWVWLQLSRPPEPQSKAA
jgi:hypothetical protein